VYVFDFMDPWLVVVLLVLLVFGMVYGWMRG
jgi:hypothetical protein